MSKAPSTGGGAEASVDPATAQILKCMGAKSTNDVVAIDCEMVGGGRKGSMLAQVSIVDFFGKSLYDMLVQPSAPIADFRTKYSGIDASTSFKGAPTFAVARGEVIRRLTGKVVVGFAIDNDLNILELNGEVPFKVFDVSKMEALQVNHPGSTTKYCPRLKLLAWACCKKKIQTKTHNATEDAEATLEVLKAVCLDAEKARADLLETIDLHAAALGEMNVPGGANYDEKNEGFMTKIGELKALSAHMAELISQYDEAMKVVPLPKGKVAKIIKELDACKTKRVELVKQTDTLRTQKESVKRIINDERRAARNAIVLEGVDPKDVVPKLVPRVIRMGGAGGGGAAVAEKGGEATATAAAATAAAAAKPVVRGGAGGPLPRRKTRRTNKHVARTRRRK